MDRQRRLGRGLEALIPSADTAATLPQTFGESRFRAFARTHFSRGANSVLMSLLNSRRRFEPAGSCNQSVCVGVETPYELIAGERRVRAATNIGWAEIQAIVRDFDDRTMLVLALVENLQRTNLNALEEARGYRRLIDEFQLTQQQVAEAVGKDRTTVTNLFRILSLPERDPRSRRAGNAFLRDTPERCSLSQSPSISCRARSSQWRRKA